MDILPSVPTGMFCSPSVDGVDQGRVIYACVVDFTTSRAAGYAVPEHFQKLEEHGHCEIHRLR